MTSAQHKISRLYLGHTHIFIRPLVRELGVLLVWGLLRLWVWGLDVQIARRYGFNRQDGWRVGEVLLRV